MWIISVCMQVVAFFVFTSFQIPRSMHLQPQTNKYLQGQKDDVSASTKNNNAHHSMQKWPLWKKCSIQWNQDPQNLHKSCDISTSCLEWNTRINKLVEY